MNLKHCRTDIDSVPWGTKSQFNMTYYQKIDDVLLDMTVKMQQTNWNRPEAIVQEMTFARDRIRRIIAEDLMQQLQKRTEIVQLIQSLNSLSS